MWVMTRFYAAARLRGLKTSGRVQKMNSPRCDEAKRNGLAALFPAALPQCCAERLSLSGECF